MLVNDIWCSHIWAFHNLFKQLYWTISDYFVACVCGLFVDSFWAVLRPGYGQFCSLFLQPVYGLFVVLTYWTVC